MATSIMNLFVPKMLHHKYMQFSQMTFPVKYRKQPVLAIEEIARDHGHAFADELIKIWALHVGEEYATFLSRDFLTVKDFQILASLLGCPILLYDVLGVMAILIELHTVRFDLSNDSSSNFHSRHGEAVVTLGVSFGNEIEQYKEYLEVDVENIIVFSIGRALIPSPVVKVITSRAYEAQHNFKSYLEEYHQVCIRSNFNLGIDNPIRRAIDEAVTNGSHELRVKIYTKKGRMFSNDKLRGRVMAKAYSHLNDDYIILEKPDSALGRQLILNGLILMEYMRQIDQKRSKAVAHTEKEKNVLSVRYTCDIFKSDLFTLLHQSTHYVELYEMVRDPDVSTSLMEEIRGTMEDLFFGETFQIDNTTSYHDFISHFPIFSVHNGSNSKMRDDKKIVIRSVSKGIFSWPVNDIHAMRISASELRALAYRTTHQLKSSDSNKLPLYLFEPGDSFSKQTNGKNKLEIFKRLIFTGHKLEGVYDELIYPQFINFGNEELSEYPFRGLFPMTLELYRTTPYVLRAIYDPLLNYQDDATCHSQNIILMIYYNESEQEVILLWFYCARMECDLRFWVRIKVYPKKDSAFLDCLHKVHGMRNDFGIKEVNPFYAKRFGNMDRELMFLAGELTNKGGSEDHLIETIFKDVTDGISMNSCIIKEMNIFLLFPNLGCYGLPSVVRQLWPWGIYLVIMDSVRSSDHLFEDINQMVNGTFTPEKYGTFKEAYVRSFQYKLCLSKVEYLELAKKRKVVDITQLFSYYCKTGNVSCSLEKPKSSKIRRIYRHVKYDLINNNLFWDPEDSKECFNSDCLRAHAWAEVILPCGLSFVGTYNSPLSTYDGFQNVTSHTCISNND